MPISQYSCPLHAGPARRPLQRMKTITVYAVVQIGSAAPHAATAGGSMEMPLNLWLLSTGGGGNPCSEASAALR